MGWLTGAASGYYIMSTLLEAIIEAHLPDFAFSNGAATGVMMAFVIITVLFNTFGARLLPFIENVSLVGHILGWLVTVILLWAMAPRNSASDVFDHVINSGGWSNTGLSFLVGTVSILYCQLGPDAAVHIGKSQILEPSQKGQY
jgi:choline transport protein